MNASAIADAIVQVEMGLNNEAQIQTIIAVGRGLSHRNVTLGLSAEDSRPILEAALAVLRAKVAP